MRSPWKEVGAAGTKLRSVTGTLVTLAPADEEAAGGKPKPELVALSTSAPALSPGVPGTPTVSVTGADWPGASSSLAGETLPNCV